MAEEKKLTCQACGKEIQKGERVTVWSDGTRREHYHRECWKKAELARAEKAKAEKEKPASAAKI